MSKIENEKADLIDRAALRDALYDADAITMRGLSILNTFPAVDAVEVKRGKWNHVAGGRTICNQCGEYPL